MIQKQQSIRNVGIVAHVDAGKTTITEQFLYISGAIRSPGSVDKGTSMSDSLSVERNRGISVRLATTSFIWKGVRINLIDTPGHVDFSAEVERSLRALDCAVLILSAAEGVQAQTGTIWQALRKLEIPTLIFANKIDRIGVNVTDLLAEINQELTEDSLPLQETVDEATAEAGVGFAWSPETYRADQEIGVSEKMIEMITEAISEKNDQLLEKYFSGEALSFSTLDKSLAEQVRENICFPVMFGVAKNSIGIEYLLDAIVRYLPSPSGDLAKPLSGVVFKIDYDKKLGKVAAVRLFDGKIETRDPVCNTTRGLEEKAIQIKKIFVQKYEDKHNLDAGDIAAICGFTEAQVGDVLGLAETVPAPLSLGTPLLTVRAVPENEEDYSVLAAALKELSDEDPLLDLQWLRDERELHIKIMGWIQIEVLEAVLRDRFEIGAKFDSPTIIYKETPSKEGLGAERYWMPKPCWAVITFLLEPGPRGSGVTYESEVSVDKIAAKYQHEIERTISVALQQGIMGWEVTDLKITLVEGEDHTVHSRPGDFIIATPMAIMNALVETGTTVLEPILDFRISAPEDLFGPIASDLTRRRATFANPVFDRGKFVMTGKIPAATSLDYPVQLSSRTGGKGKISTTLSGYEVCLPEHAVETPYRGISPLDRAKYILQARKAL